MKKTKHKNEVYTFRVTDVKGQTLNHVRVAVSERPGDTYEIMIAKRKEVAENFRTRWAAGYFSEEQLLVVPCDGRGQPV